MRLSNGNCTVKEAWWLERTSIVYFFDGPLTSLVSFVCIISDLLSLLCQYGHQYLSDVWVLIQAVGFEVKKTTPAYAVAMLK